MLSGNSLSIPHALILSSPYGYRKIFKLMASLYVYIYILYPIHIVWNVLLLFASNIGYLQIYFIHLLNSRVIRSSMYSFHACIHA